jgi:hypothetical protein
MVPTKTAGWTIATTLLLAGFGSVAHAQAESFDAFRFDVGMFVPYGYGQGNYGFGVALEPKFNLTDHLSLGARVEAAVQGGGNAGVMNATINEAASAAFLAKADYFFTTGGVRPFLSLGTGIYDMAGQSLSAGAGGAAIAQEAGRFFGVASQAGVDIGRVRLALAYELLVGADVDVQQQVGSVTQRSQVSRDYLALELGFRFGGAPRVAAAPASAMP